MRKNKIQILFAAILALNGASLCLAQQPVPAQAQSKAVLLLNGTIHMGNGTVIQNGALAFENGKITFCDEASKMSMDKSVYEVKDVAGKHVYPGFIAPNTSLGLSEIELVRSTNDYYEVGNMNAHVRALISYNTDSKIPPTVRSNGILLAQSVPQGGTISGQSSIMELDGWNWEDAAFKADDGIHLNWPRMFIQRGWWAEPEDVQKQNTEKEIHNIRTFFNEAKAYSNSSSPEKNLRFEAMKGLFAGQKKLFVHAYYIKEIIASVNFCKELGIVPVLVGAADAWMATEFLKENKIALILQRTHSLPAREDDDVDLPYKLPSILQKAGIPFCLSVDGFWQVRNLPFMAGTAMAYGLSAEEALSSITSNTANILGIADRVGTLEKGKDATLFVSSGNALDMSTNAVEMAFIRGKNIELTNVQTALNKKYKDKYGLK